MLEHFFNIKILGRLFVANSMEIVLWKLAHFNIKQIKWVCVGGPLFCFTKVQLYKHDRKWGHMPAALHMKQNSRRTEGIKGSFWSSRLCVVPCFPLNGMWHTARVGYTFSCYTPQWKLTTNISSAVENLPYYQLMTAELLCYLVLFSFPLLLFWEVLEMRAAVVITAGASQVHQEFRMPDSWCYITADRFQGEGEPAVIEAKKRNTLISFCKTHLPHFFSKVLDIVFTCVAWL